MNITWDENHRYAPTPVPERTERSAGKFPTENELIRRAQKRDSAAFVVLYDKYVSKIYRYIYLKVTNVADAQDLTAQVFANAWEALDRYRITETPFVAWLYRIAHNQIVDFYRKSRREDPIDDLSIEEPGIDLAGLVQQQFTAAIVRDALRRLTEAQRQVLVLRFVEGYSTQEAAVIMKRNPGAVRTLQHRALASLKSLLRDDSRLPERSLPQTARRRRRVVA